MPAEKLDERLRWVVARVALLNLAYFGIEFSVALAIASHSSHLGCCVVEN
jgi:hypothetical protein